MATKILVVDNYDSFVFNLVKKPANMTAYLFHPDPALQKKPALAST
jgi:anthranilate/para-aminobenzoate synthase component II